MEKQEHIKNLLKKANTLPEVPGVYIMRDAKNTVIYVGKAKILKNRVTQYFRHNAQHTPKVLKMVSLVEQFEYIVCDSEFEALILECSLIKQYSPKYNILLKDDKGYHYVKIIKGRRPDIQYVKQKENDGAEYLGPYNSGWIVRQTVNQAKKIYKLADCNRKFDVKTKPCLNYHIGLCSAPCGAKISLSDYTESFLSAVDFIKKGGIGDSEIKALEQQMITASENLEFELAARLRDRIAAIKKIYQQQKVIIGDNKRQDVFAIAAVGSKVCFEVFNFKNGKLSDRFEHILECDQTKPEIRAAFLKSFYETHEIPPIILTDGEVEDCELLTRYLSEKSGRKVSISVPQRATPLKIVNMCANNAAEYLSAAIQRSSKETQSLDELAELLGLSQPPRYIEAYDISNTAGSENVAAMTVFCDARPKKDAYRRFKIKGFLGQDDYRSMREVLERRFNEYENKTPGFDVLPDLILLDGGKGQISAVKDIVSKYGVALFGMVKDSKHRTRAIATSGGDISIKANRKAYTLITNIQDETHRFAITYHKARSTKKNLASALCEIESIGNTRAMNLLKHFKTLTAIKNASVEQLCEVKGINKSAAENIYNHFRK